MGLCKWKEIKQKDFLAVQKKYVGQHFDAEEIKAIFVQIGFNKSHYLVKTLEEFKIIKKNSDGTYSISNEGGITEPLLHQCGQAVSKKDNPKMVVQNTKFVNMYLRSMRTLWYETD